ncbi:hypothetical protein MLD38_021797 [Melastoma candidum]|uniref:Uncharacterized protein n=1 Tax=Melastoma candidum TaxID=119954 RepID=A0ACB9QGJ9_9MYRT|nr:hypothetical protein MLD38_021797 [Melastoma candidum]
MKRLPASAPYVGRPRQVLSTAAPSVDSISMSRVLYSFDIPADSSNNYPWQIHPKCAQLPHKLKHSCHEHHLELRIIYLVFACGACGSYGNVAGYYCEACTLYFHVMCTIYLEESVLHERHWHPLVLCTIPRDETDEYYCEICATHRHPDLWAYYCKPCEYEAHISCVNPRIKPCNPNVLLPENRAEGKICDLLDLYESLPDVRNPVLDENSGSKVMWEPVGDEERGRGEKETSH